MERSFRIPEIGENLGQEGKAGIAGGLGGFIVGVSFDMVYLEQPSMDFDAKIAQARAGIAGLDHLRGDLHVVAPPTRQAVKKFIHKDSAIKQAEIGKLISHKPSTPSAPEQVGIVLGSIGFFGMAAVTLTLGVQEYKRKRVQKREAKARELEIEMQVRQEVEQGLELLDLWRKRR